MTQRSSLPWILSTAAHVAVVCGVVQAGDHPPRRQPVSVEIIHRPPAPRAAAGPPAAPEPPRPVVRRVRPRPAPVPVALPAPVAPSSSPAAVELPVTPAAPPRAAPAMATAAQAPSLPALARPGGGGTDLDGYLGFVNRAVAARRHYPPMALQLSLEGTVEVRVCVRRDGTLAARPTVLRSSGHELLDNEALQMVARAAPFPPLPDGYGYGSAELRVPVRFYLD